MDALEMRAADNLAAAREDLVKASKRYDRIVREMRRAALSMGVQRSRFNQAKSDVVEVHAGRMTSLMCYVPMKDRPLDID